MPGWNKHQQSPLSAGSFSELLLRDDLARPGHGIEDRFKAVGRGRLGRRKRLRCRPASRGPAMVGRSHWTMASYGGRLADLFRLLDPGQRPGCRWATRDPLARHGDYSPERDIEHPFAPVDFLAHVKDQRRELGCIARPDPGAERGQATHERAAPAHCRPRRHLRNTQAPKRKEAPVRAGRPGGISGVVHWRSPLDNDHRYRLVLCDLR